jgi:hypothetical protein
LLVAAADGGAMIGVDSIFSGLLMDGIM